jgi:hypothetical protein
MKSLKDILKPGSSPKSPSVAEQGRAVGEADGDGPLLDPEVKGVDARRLAELKADEAGRKWRREAEAKGEKPKEAGGPQGLEPTRYGDWEKAGRCFDF